MIRIDALWLSTEPLDMRGATESALARVLAVFGAARPHHAYPTAQRRPRHQASRIDELLPHRWKPSDV